MSSGLSIVIPVYKSEQMLEELVAQVRLHVEQLTRQFEIILINDGSPDNSWSVIERLAHERDFVRGIDLGAVPGSRSESGAISLSYLS